jgi:hypothetical protein
LYEITLLEFEMNVKNQENLKTNKNPLLDSFRFVTILILLLVVMSGCAFLGLQENKLIEEVYFTCGNVSKGRNVNFIKLENRMNYKYILTFARYEDSTKSSFTGYYMTKLNHHSYFFVIGDIDHDYELSKFQDSLKKASTELSVYIYINTLNQELINQTFKKLANTK